MPQSPFKTDQVEIEPKENEGQRLIRRGASGALEFLDSLVTGGITLSQLAGLRSVGGVLVVGKTGTGAEYNTIQAALDAIPSNASITNPFVVFICPGEYAETINLVRDGVMLIGLGPVFLKPVVAVANAQGAYHTVVVQADQGTIPLNVVLRGLTITNNHDNFACVRASGGAASTVASGTWGVRLEDCNLEANAPGRNRPIHASSVGRVIVQGGTWNAGTGLLLIEEITRFEMHGVSGVSPLQLDFDTNGTLPSGGNVFGYKLANCLFADTVENTPFVLTGTGQGSLGVFNCGNVPAVTLNGDVTAIFSESSLMGLTLNDTIAVVLRNSDVASAPVGAANTSLDRAVTQGTLTFNAEATKAGVFAIPMPDATFDVHVELPSRPVNDETPWVTGKATTGFTLNFQTAQTMVVRWTAVRR